MLVARTQREKGSCPDGGNRLEGARFGSLPAGFVILFTATQSSLMAPDNSSHGTLSRSSSRGPASLSRRPSDVSDRRCQLPSLTAAVRVSGA